MKPRRPRRLLDRALLCTLAAAAFGAAFSPVVARSDEPAQASAPIAVTTPNPLPPAPSKDGLRATRWEPAIVPELNYDSNVGFGFGAIGTLARFDPRFDPYRFRLEAQLFLSLAIDEARHPSLPYHDHFVRGDFPGLLGDRLRLFVAVGFGKFANSGYYGLGQLAPRRKFKDAELAHSESARRFYTYDRLTPHTDAIGQIMLRTVKRPARDARLALLVGGSASYNGMTTYAGSRLEEDEKARSLPTPQGRYLASLLHGTSDHGMGTLALGILWDSRDHDFAPSSGTLTELSMKAGFAAGAHETMGFARFHLSTNWYSPLYRDVVVFAHRAVLDWLVGDPPFYELSQYGIAHLEEGPGGDGSVRGVLLRRYHGKVKVIDNVELRLQAPWFTIVGVRFRVGAAFFLDAGRVWAQVPVIASLDGPWAPFAVGMGGGLRLRWGETFILRADLATSPTDHTTGFSIDLGHVF